MNNWKPWIDQNNAKHLKLINNFTYSFYIITFIFTNNFVIFVSLVLWVVYNLPKHLKCLSVFVNYLYLSSWQFGLYLLCSSPHWPTLYSIDSVMFPSSLSPSPFLYSTSVLIIIHQTCVGRHIRLHCLSDSVQVYKLFQGIYHISTFGFLYFFVAKTLKTVFQLILE